MSTESLSAAEFVDLANHMIFAGFDEHFDVPELWTAVSAFAREDAAAVVRHLRAHPAPSPLIRGTHAFADEAWHMLLHLASFTSGASTEADLVELAAFMLARHSQEAIVTGYAFHVKRLFAPDDYDLRDYVCEAPFQQLDILENSSHLCCASWLHKSAGDLSDQSHEEVWNSDAAEAIRQSVLDGSYRYCNKTACKKLPSRTLTPKAALMNDPWWANVITNHVGKLDRGPERVNLSYDKHCNLSCPSCRTELITSDNEVRDRLDRITQRNVFPLLTSAKQAFVTGSGDPFASRTFRKMLGWISDETCPDLEVVLMTNGMLLTEKEWAKFPNLRGKVKLVSVSVDGATKETHELLRRGSKWETMMENLPFIGRLRAEGQIARFQIVMVVQKENFREMGAFVDLAKAVNASRVYFETLTNWGTFSAQEYAEKAVHGPTHPLHAELLAVMSDPRLREPIVAWGGLKELLPAEARAAA